MPLAPSPQWVHRTLTPCSLQQAAEDLHFGIRVADELIDGNRNRDAELLHVLDVAAEVDHALLKRDEIFLLELFLGRYHHGS